MPAISRTEVYDRFNIKTHDPYGFNYITPINGGASPAELSGCFTSVTLAKRAIDGFNAMKNKEHALMIAEKRKPENFEYKNKKIAQERKAALKEKKNVEVTEEDTSEEVITTEE